MTTTQTTNLQTILDWIDQIKLKKAEANPHPVAACDDHEKEVYARMLSCVLLGGEGIAEGQARVFQLILNALGLSDRRARIFEEASQPDREFVEEFVELASKQGWADGFLVDGMVLCRLEQSLTEQQDQLFTEMAALLGVHDHRLPELVSVAAIILGLPEPSPLKRNFDFRPFGFWEEFLYRELTLEHLRDGINNGFWRIDKPLVTDFSWEVIGASIRFEEKGQLVCLGRESGVRIQFNTLINPLICFYKLDYVNLRGANIIGKYSQASEQSSIIVHESNKLNISKCKFETVGARALAISTRKDSQESNSISDTLFTHCGNKNLVGGAVAITSTKAAAYTITDCQFHQCSAFIGGGLYARYLGKLHGCSFFNCASQSFPRFTANEYDFLGVGDGVFANETNIPKRLFKCEFSNCGLNLGVVTYRFSSSNGICYEDQDACYNSVFNNSHATYYIQDGRKLGFRECEFDPGEPGAKSLKIDQDVMLSNYTETYWSTLIEKWEEDFEKSTMIAGGVTAGRVVGPNLGSWITAKLFD